MSILQIRNYDDTNKLIAQLTSSWQFLRYPLACAIAVGRNVEYLVNGRFKAAQYKTILPNYKLNNDFTLTDPIKHAKAMSFLDFFQGRITNLYTAIALPVTRDLDARKFKQYILDSQDFVSENGTYKLHKTLFNCNVDICVRGQDVYVDNVLFENCSTEKQQETLNIIYILQQPLQHLINHYLPTYGYNMLRLHNINMSSPVMSLVLDCGNNIRKQTESFGFPEIFDFKNSIVPLSDRKSVV